MVLNTSKTKSMLITTHQKLSRLPKTTLNCKIGQTALDSVSEECLLGVVVDQHLNWKSNTNSIYKKVNSRIALLRRIKCYLPLSTRRTYYNAYILPHLDYCCSAWGTSANIYKLFKLQKRAVRIMMDSDYNYPTKELFRYLHIMPLPDRIKYKNMCLVFKSLKHMVPSYMTDMFRFVNQRHSRVTRASSQNMLDVPRAKLNVFKNTWSIQSAIEWNKLKIEVKSSETLVSFKSCYLRYYWEEF